MADAFDTAAMYAGLDTQTEALVTRIMRWSSMNSGSANLAGLEAMLDALSPCLDALADSVERVSLPVAERVDDCGVVQAERSADALLARCRPDAAQQALLVIHFDTVYGQTHPFQKVDRTQDEKFGDALHGPGVTDAKGGIAVMLAALEAFEKYADDAMKQRLGWTVVLNPDEETGSHASRELLHAEAKRATFGMVYEPALPNGDLIGARKGSGNFAVVVRGEAAHAGREFFKGRNAIVAAAGLATTLSGLTDETTGTTINVAKIAGGGANNVVPALAVLRGNARVADEAAQARVEAALGDAVAGLNQCDGLRAELHGGFNNPPKPLSDGASRMFEALREVGHDPRVGVDFEVRSSGGVCDGNKLAAYGLPVVDTLGPVGRDIHSDRETLAIASLVPRTKLSAGLLAGVALEDFSFL